MTHEYLKPFSYSGCTVKTCWRLPLHSALTLQLCMHSNPWEAQYSLPSVLSQSFTGFLHLTKVPFLVLCHETVSHSGFSLPAAGGVCDVTTAGGHSFSWRETPVVESSPERKALGFLRNCVTKFSKWPVWPVSASFVHIFMNECKCDGVLVRIPLSDSPPGLVSPFL